MILKTKRQSTLYVDKASQQWIVLDPEGSYWLLPPVEDPWRHRIPFEPSQESDLQPVPGHYKIVLGLPN